MVFVVGSVGPHARLTRVVDGQWRPASRTCASVNAEDPEGAGASSPN